MVRPLDHAWARFDYLLAYARTPHAAVLGGRFGAEMLGHLRNGGLPAVRVAACGDGSQESLEAKGGAL